MTQLTLAGLKQEGDTPYQIWIHIGRDSNYNNDIAWRKKDALAWDEQALTVVQGLALLRARPDIILIAKSNVILAGSWLSQDRTVQFDIKSYADPRPTLTQNTAYVLMDSFPDITRGKLSQLKP